MVQPTFWQSDISLYAPIITVKTLNVKMSIGEFAEGNCQPFKEYEKGLLVYDKTGE